MLISESTLAAVAIGVALAALVVVGAILIGLGWRNGRGTGGPGHWPPVWRTLRRLAVAVIGSTVMLVGVALLVLPGPASLVLPVGLAILATEFGWARHALDRIRRVLPGLRRERRSPDASPAHPSGRSRQPEPPAREGGPT